MFGFICLELIGLKVLLAAAVAGFFGVAYLYSTWTHSHWSRMGIPCPYEPLPLFGHALSIMTGRMHFMNVLRDIYDKMGDRPYIGIYTMRTPQLLIKDPNLIGHIMIKDFNHFTDRGLYSGAKANPLNNNIFFERGERWKTMRHKLSPTFTANKLKHMNAQVSECSNCLVQTIDRLAVAGHVEIRDTMAKYSTDVIGSCAFGLKLDAINDPDSEFRKHGRHVFQPSLRSKINVAFIFLQPSLLNFFCVQHYSHRTVAFFRDAFQQTIQHRLQHPDPERKDFVYHLMQARNELVLNPDLRPEEKFTEMDIVANAYILFVAGFETVSTTMSFCLYELAFRKDIQNKVRNEILEIRSKYGGKISSESTNELNYLSLVIKETLRKYPPLVALNRVVTKPYTIPGTKIELKTGTNIVIPAHALHYDPKYYPNPNDFIPERFSEENIHNLTSNTYMPFGIGPRICIGKRFAEFEMKVALSEVLTNYEVMPCDKTQIPVKYVIGSFVNIPESIWLKFKRINN